VAHLLNVVMCIRTSGLTFTSAVPPDREWLDYLWELGELADRGGDIRTRVFG
jgi:hypothetical protein